MPAAKTTSSRRPTPRRQPKVAQTFRLRPGLVKSVRKALGAKSDTEAVERALDMIAFGKDVFGGMERAFGADVLPPEEA